MGKTRAAYEAVQGRIETVHGPEGTTPLFGSEVKLTLRTPFEAVEAGDFERTGLSCVVGMTADQSLVYSGASRRIVSGVNMSVFLVAMLPGRGDVNGKGESDLLGDLLDAVDLVVVTLETAATNPTGTYAALQVVDTTVLYDDEGNYASVEIRLNLSVTRA